MAENINLADDPPRVRYIADGIQTIYETPFPVFKEKSLIIYLDDQVLSCENYTTELDEQLRATITFAEAPATQTVITIMRNLPIERTSNFQEASILRSDVLNYEFNYLMACLQQLTDALKRSMILPPYAVDTTQNLTLPLPNAGKAIVWTADGTGLENSTVSINALEKTFSDYKTAAETAGVMASAKANEAVSAATTAGTKAAEAAASAAEAAQSVQAISGALITKANTDLDNLTQTAQETIVGLGMPDYTRGISVPVNSTFTPSTNGFIEYKVYCTSNSGGRFFICEETSDGRAISGLINVASGYIHSAQQVRVVKNKIYYILSSNAIVDYVNFYPAKGA